MQIAVASGKGGTGKTTIAAALALSLADEHTVRVLDCDVEAPNAHLVLKPVFDRQAPAVIRIPQIDAERCTACGKCVLVCQFHALAKVGKTILVFTQLCHGCGSCTWNCPEGAISEVPNQIGKLEAGRTKEDIRFAQGVLTISEPMPTPVIRQLKRWDQTSETDVTILDAPPGASCSVVETLRGSDYALFVTEPTPFGLHDLKQALGIAQEMNIPAGVVINRDGIGDDQVDRFLSQNDLPVLLRIPFSKTLAAGIAAGKSLIEELPEYRSRFKGVFRQIVESIAEGKSC